MCIQTMKKIWRRLFPKKAAPAAEAPVAAARERRPKVKEQVRRMSTALGGPNMPKRQPCPDCRRWVKRDSKTAEGAYYLCPVDGLFFVSA